MTQFHKNPIAVWRHTTPVVPKLCTAVPRGDTEYLKILREHNCRLWKVVTDNTINHVCEVIPFRHHTNH